jgi:redox-sensitive bicupin YhaK (pirin superfamily)
VQWMTAGSGIIHSEGPSEEFAKEGGTMELIQLWINLPRDYKMTTPKYQDISSSTFPVIKEDKAQLKLVTGDYKGQKGPASTFTPILAMMVDFDENAHLLFDVPESYNTLVYLLDGKLNVDGTEVAKLNLIQFNNDGEQVGFQSNEKGKLLLLAGEPINEPISSYGPFVMNYPGEIKQAILDYETGKMGSLDF